MSSHLRMITENCLRRSEPFTLKVGRIKSFLNSVAKINLYTVIVSLAMVPRCFIKIGLTLSFIFEAENEL